MEITERMVTDGAADAQAQAPTSNSSEIPLPQVIENESGPGGGHAYPNHADTLVKVHLPGATQLSVTFDEQCETEERYDELRFFDHDPGDSKEERSENAFFTWSGRRTPDMMSKVSNPFWVGFQSDGSGVRWGYKFTVRDVRADGMTSDEVSAIVNSLGWELAVNRRSTTWRQLDEVEKTGLDNAKAIALISANPTLMKRPVFVSGDKMLAGFTPKIQSELESLI